MLDVLGTADTVGTEAEVGQTEVDQEGGEEVTGGILTWCRWQHCEYLGVHDTLFSVG